MKYKQMSLREAFHYLRSRRHIIGPNFGFIKQLITYEKSLFGYTSVSFVNTSFGSVPDIYLSIPTSRSRRQTTTPIPMQTTNNNNTLGRTTISSARPTTPVNSLQTRSAFLYSSTPTLSLPPRQQSFVNRSITSALPARSTTTISNYTNAYNPGANSSNNRPVSSSSAYQNRNLTTGINGYKSSLSIRQPSEPSHINSITIKPFELTRELYVPTKINTFRTVKYVPSSYNRYHLP